MQKTLLSFLIAGLAGCATHATKRDTYDLINAEMTKAVETTAQPAQQDAVFASLLPPLTIEMPKTQQSLEERFNLSFSNAPAVQFFMGIVSGTRYNMLVHPDVTGSISAKLNNVTLFETLDAIREIYGYEYKVEGTRIYVKPPGLQTSIFQVNYLNSNRGGTSNIRVTSSAASNTTSGNPGTDRGSASPPTAGTPSQSTEDSSNITTTTSKIDFWEELRASLGTIVGNTDGRSVVINQQSGVVVIRAMSGELRNVSNFLKATQLSVDRQVILEAKIMEVELNDSFQSGINWASFASLNAINNNRSSLGFVSPGSRLAPLPLDGSNPAELTSGGNNAINAISGIALGAASSAAGGLFGLAFQTSNFAALISFLESQGTVHVLSSPRIATMNNQKAVLKVGTDEYFVTQLTTTPATTSSGNITTEATTTVDTQSFFSGVALDVTPQIDESGNITLHVHPSVSQVTSSDLSIDLGVNGSLRLPLAKSVISETDSVVRGQDGRIIAIGGLMRQESLSDRSQVPGAGNIPVVGNLFRNTNRVSRKRELVILIKPTVIQGDDSWAQNMLDSQRRIQGLAPRDEPGMY